jgi:putative transposase
MTVSKSIPSDLLNSLLSDYQKPEDLLGENGLLKQLTKALVERALEAEMTDHLGHAKHDPVAHPSGNTRNGKSKKTLKGDFGELPIEIPRDRQGHFGPQLIPKHQTRWAGFDDKIISLHPKKSSLPPMQVRESNRVDVIVGLEDTLLVPN